MTDWTAGYVADIGYTYGSYAELNPQWANLAFAAAGLATPEMATVCELGFGQGVGVNIHAAAQANRQYWATDFIPAQAAFAQSLAKASGSGAHLFDQSFAEFGARDDLPEFDFIGLHGIWSWISDDNRREIVSFLRRRLKVGGILYLSYNTLPGWAALMPLRHLMTQHAEAMTGPGQGIPGRVGAALEFADRLFATQPSYARDNVKAVEQLASLKDHSHNYLAHEYFNRDWHPMYFSDVADWLAPAKLNYACSATYHDHVDTFNLTIQQQEMLKSIDDVTHRETVRDFMVNQTFRRDYWVKGARKMTPFEQADALRSQRVMLLTTRSEVVLKKKVALGEVTMDEAIFVPVLDLLADHRPRSIGELAESLQDKMNFSQLLQTMMVLTGKGDVGPVQADEMCAASQASTRKLNAALMSRARGSDEITYLASPVSGGGVPLTRIQQLFLLALSQGQEAPGDWAKFAWETLRGVGQRLRKNGQLLETSEENLSELVDQAQRFADQRLPALRVLQVI